ncbi:hypothetical protein chiPu_0021268 [Chiloscyllium punctatum]|uniref:Uncharacterized protein n=1 Tax=Chiloscyllium punctatum TaxID=137246 RepID=A0A401RPL7_CHIPU|nr:hypothetical protein [Chiloscyllium punctatum]
MRARTDVWVMATCRVLQMASSVQRLERYTNSRVSNEGGGLGASVSKLPHDEHLENVHDDECKRSGAEVTEQRHRKNSSAQRQ